MKRSCKRCGEKTGDKWEICLACKKILVEIARDIQLIKTHHKMIEEYGEDGYNINKV